MSEKAILVLLDGCCYDTATENLGYLEHLVSVGKCNKYCVRGELPSLSRPMYETLLTGMPVDQHGITNNLVIRPSKEISLFDLSIEKGRTTAAAAYHWMSELYSIAPFNPVTDRIQLTGVGKIQYGIYYFEDHYPDTHVYSDAEYLRQRYAPDFLLVHPMNIDDAGHRYGCFAPEYHRAVALNNILLSSMIPIWLEAGYQIMVTADHGMNEHHLHGGNTDRQRLVPLYLISDRLKKQGEDQRILSQLLIAPILCSLMKLEPSAAMLKLSEMGAEILEA